MWHNSGSKFECTGTIRIMHAGRTGTREMCAEDGSKKKSTHVSHHWTTKQYHHRIHNSLSNALRREPHFPITRCGVLQSISDFPSHGAYNMLRKQRHDYKTEKTINPVYLRRRLQYCRRSRIRNGPVKNVNP